MLTTNRDNSHPQPTSHHALQGGPLPAASSASASQESAQGHDSLLQPQGEWSPDHPQAYLAVHASPADVPEAFASNRDAPVTHIDQLLASGKHVPFWRPGLFFIAKSIGWKWLLLGPALVAAMGMPAAIAISPKLFVFLGIELKLWLFAIGISTAIIGHAMATCIKRRVDAFCIHCGYTLQGLGSAGKCSECGRAFVAGLSDEYKKDPHFFRERVKQLRRHPQNVWISASSGPQPAEPSPHANPPPIPPASLPPSPPA